IISGTLRRRRARRWQRHDSGDHAALDRTDHHAGRLLPNARVHARRRRPVAGRNPVHGWHRDPACALRDGGSSCVRRVLRRDAGPLLPHRPNQLRCEESVHRPGPTQRSDDSRIAIGEHRERDARHERIPDAHGGRAACARLGVRGHGLLHGWAAGTYPERFAAAASYHGSSLATDAPDSPHLLAPRMRAWIYVAGAIEDRNFDDAQKQRLDDALTRAGVRHTVETYNARHGWVPSDTPVHDAVETEHHWRTLLDLFARTLF